jgi:hypothetical protein
MQIMQTTMMRVCSKSWQIFVFKIYFPEIDDEIEDVRNFAMGLAGNNRDEDEFDEEEQDDVKDPFKGKIGAKKLKKLEAKAERKEMNLVIYFRMTNRKLFKVFFRKIYLYKSKCNVIGKSAKKGKKSLRRKER